MRQAGASGFIPKGQIYEQLYARYSGGDPRFSKPTSIDPTIVERCFVALFHLYIHTIPTPHRHFALGLRLQALIDQVRTSRSLSTLHFPRSDRLRFR